MFNAPEASATLCARRQIAAILHQLEVETGQQVESISVDDIEVTSIGSDRPESLRCVRIRLRVERTATWST